MVNFNFSLLVRGTLNLIEKLKISLQREENYYFCYLKLFFLLNFVRIIFLEISKQINLLWKISSLWCEANPWTFLLICKSIIHSNMERGGIFSCSCPKRNLPKLELFQNLCLRIALFTFHCTSIVVSILPSHTAYKNCLCNSILKQLYTITP